MERAAQRTEGTNEKASKFHEFRRCERQSARARAARVRVARQLRPRANIAFEQVHIVIVSVATLPLADAHRRTSRRNEKAVAVGESAPGCWQSRHSNALLIERRRAVNAVSRNAAHAERNGTQRERERNGLPAGLCALSARMRRRRLAEAARLSARESRRKREHRCRESSRGHS